MEKAVKALYIAAGVLITVMVLSLAAVLYASLQGYVDNTNKQIKFNSVNSFNTKYLNYINISNGEKQFDLRIQDIITIASATYENNRSNNIDINQWDATPNSLYVEVLLNGTRIDQTINEQMVELLQTNKDTTFQCSANDVLISENTGQVYSISFSTFN